MDELLKNSRKKELKNSQNEEKRTIDEGRWQASLEIPLTGFGILLTLLLSAAGLGEQYPILKSQIEAGDWALALGHSLFLGIIAILIYGSLIYQTTRLGYLKRRRAHRPASAAELGRHFSGPVSPLAILVPSYKEDRRTIMQTLISAALQEYPNRRVVLLIDDPAHPKTAADAALLADARALPKEICALLEKPAKAFHLGRLEFVARQNQKTFDTEKETRIVMEHWRAAATWFESQGRDTVINDHTDRFYVEEVLLRRASTHRKRARRLEKKVAQSQPLGKAELLQEYTKLASLFQCDITSFERKRYLNLSHESNKAMNLNSYISLVGKRYVEANFGENRILQAINKGPAQIDIPDADYLITLDADSILLPKYALRLIHFMEQAGNERLAVAQTPYSAIPGTTNRLERVAGATTDIQYIIHQGFTQHHATYWVGANALLRHSALKDIAVTRNERGYPVTRFIQDRTVIEDTESSVNLIARGWTLHNYPERLAYSATPPDFGALLIQRRRWANGGLIILPKLLGYLSKDFHVKIREGLVRIHYLISIAGVNIGLLLMLTFPFTDSIRSLWLPLTALPYFFFYGRDLCLCGYRKRDLFRVYALNLLLIPVNLGGVFKSLQQGITKVSIPFGRTPKVSGRTATPALYLLATYALVLHWTINAGLDFYAGLWAHGFFAIVNSAILFYAIANFIGFRESREDLRVAMGNRSSPQPIRLPEHALIQNDTVFFSPVFRRRCMDTPLDSREEISEKMGFFDSNPQIRKADRRKTISA